MSKAYFNWSEITSIFNGDVEVKSVFKDGIEIWKKEQAPVVTGAPLTFTANSDFQIIKLSKIGNPESTPNLMYSVDNGETWSKYVIGIGIALYNSGDNVMFKADEGGNDSINGSFSYLLNQYGQLEDGDGRYSFDDSSVTVSGNVLSMLKEDCNVKSIPDGCFYSLFKSCENIKIDIEDVSAESAGFAAFASMFYGCSSIEKAFGIDIGPIGLGGYCCYDMFRSCTNLLAPPVLNSMKLGIHCYEGMFSLCKSMQSFPSLPALHMEDSCYEGMFARCESAVEPPELPSSDLAANCYYRMFQRCISLKRCPELPARILKNGCYQQMFYGCQAMENIAKLPALTLESMCYVAMFYDCNSISGIAELGFVEKRQGVGVGEDGPYHGMFTSCVNLDGIKTYVSNVEGFSNDTRTPGSGSYDPFEYGTIKRYPENGVLTCPEGLDLSGGFDFLPDTWTVQRF